MLDGEANFGECRDLAFILQGVHAKLDRLTADQQQIAIRLGVSLGLACTPEVARSVDNNGASRHYSTELADSDAEIFGRSDSKVNAGLYGNEEHGKMNIDLDDSAENPEFDSECCATDSNISKLSGVEIECNDDHGEATELCDDMSPVRAAQTLKMRAFMQEGQTSDEARWSEQESNRTLRASFGFGVFADDGTGVLTRIIRSLPLQRYSIGVVLFDFVGVLLLFKDSLQVPYTVVNSRAWRINESRAHLFVIDIMSATFWTGDLLLRFVISPESEDDGVLKSEAEKSTVRISAACYLKGWFIVDFMLLVFDWFACVAEAVQHSAPTFWKLVRVVKFSRVVRILAVIRSNKFAHVKDVSMQRFQSHETVVVIIDFIWNTIRLLLFCLWLGHFEACAWIFVTTEYSQGGKNWEVSVAQMHDQNARSFVDANLSQTFRYGVAYYWAVTTMFSGSSFLPPMTTAECWFGSGCVFFGVLSVTIVISSTSAHIVRIMEKQRERTLERENLRKFLQQHQVRPLLSLQIQRQAKERSRDEARVAEEEVRIVSCLSSELRNQLRFNLYGPVLHSRPLWRACEYIDGHVMWSMCISAMSFKRYTPGEIVFEENSDVEGSFTLVWGSMKYSCLKQKGQRQKTASNCFTTSYALWKPKSWETIRNTTADEYDRLVLLPKNIACENSLWIEWKTVGHLEALVPCEMLVCSSKGLAIVMKEVSCAARSVIRGYAQAVIDFSASEQETYRLSDVCTETDYYSIVRFMPAGLRVSMSAPALKVLRKDMAFALFGKSFSGLENGHSGGRRRSNMTESQLDAIEKEVYDGRCDLGQDESDTILRIVRVVVLILRRADGLICVEVGHAPDGMNKPIPRIRLPGRKLRMKETLKDCALRMIRQHFAVLESHITVSYGSVDVQVAPSKSYSIPTKYIRLVVDALIFNTGLLVATADHQCAWGEEAIECFAWFDADHRSVVIYAWMTPDQYDRLQDLDKEGEALVASWIDGFTSTEIMDARRGALLMTL